MPIYEFRCLKCDECFELLVINKSDRVEMQCPACQSEDFERVLSASCHQAVPVPLTTYLDPVGSLDETYPSPRKRAV
jgi:putative FmdB family regulatory protein